MRHRFSSLVGLKLAAHSCVLTCLNSVYRECRLQHTPCLIFIQVCTNPHLLIRLGVQIRQKHSANTFSILIVVLTCPFNTAIILHAIERSGTCRLSSYYCRIRSHDPQLQQNSSYCISAVLSVVASPMSDSVYGESHLYTDKTTWPK